LKQAVQASSGSGQFQLVCVIVNFGVGSRVLQIAKESGVPGGTVFLGKGTVENRLLRLLELSDSRKEVVLMVAGKSVVSAALRELDRVLRFDKPNHGIAFTIPVSAYLGTGRYEYEEGSESGGVEQSMHHAIFVIVDRGKGQQVMDLARDAGARGGTIINARGSGIHEHSKLLNMEIEPEKEVVLIITEHSATRGIVLAVRDGLEIDKPGNGIIFVQPVLETYGIR
jgi:nitrogen regulatory protein PII